MQEARRKKRIVGSWWVAAACVVALLFAPRVARADGSGSLGTSFSATLQGGGVVSQGAGYSGRGSTAKSSVAIGVAGIPNGATVHKAFLYWAVIGGTDTTATLNANAVTGALIGTAGDTCWSLTNNNVYRSDVTAFVAGNGSYTVSGLPSATAGADTQGVSLVVVYKDDASPNKSTVVIQDGAIAASASGTVMSGTFSGFTVPANRAAASFRVMVGDGQSFDDGAVVFNGLNLGINQFQATDGNYWDDNTYGVLSVVTSGLTSAPYSVTTGSDCLLFAGATFNYDFPSPLDTDGDGVTDTADNCPTVANANQANNDGDAQGDACDTDDDNDTVLDVNDNCQFVANILQTNTDGAADGGDACDADDDNDTIADAMDNCPVNANQNQLNTDGDAQGDACEADDDNDRSEERRVGKECQHQCRYRWSPCQ
jgi:ferredoxin